MLKKEAQWLGDRLGSWDEATAPILNVGSANAELRTRIQPWIHQLMFAPLARRKLTVWHQDLFAGDGVDLVGDLCDPLCQARARELGIRSVICCNVLEHVPDPAGFARVLLELVPTGGRLLISVPNAFPYHPDPIDTMFRPSVEELAALFPGTEVVTTELLTAGRLQSLVLDNPQRALERARELPREVVARIRGKQQPTARVERHERRSEALLPWIIRPFKLACLELQRL